MLNHNHFRAALAAFSIATLAASPAHAEVKKFMSMCGGSPQGLQLCPHYQVALHAPDGWQEDEAAGKKNRLQIVVPKGKTFGDAPALIYFKVSLRQKDRSIEDFIKLSHEHWMKSVPDAKIVRLGEVERTNGKPAFMSYRFDNPSKPQQAAEIVSYGFDADTDGNDFVLMVVMTGHEKKALDQADQPYKALLRAH